MKTCLYLIPLLLLGCNAAERNSSEDVTAMDMNDMNIEESAPINTHCPRSGKKVSMDSLAEYRGQVVGFCNQHCRDDFAANIAERPKDTDFFDAIIDALP